MSQNIKTIELINRLSKANLKELDQWMLSPLFYRNKTSLIVYQAIRTFKFTTFNAIKHHIGTQKKVSESYIRSLLNEINQAIEKFLIYKELALHPITEQSLLYEHLNRINTNSKLLDQTLESFKELQSLNLYENYLKSYYLNHYMYSTSHNFNNNQSLNDLNIFYFVNYFKHWISYYFYTEQAKPLMREDQIIFLFEKQLNNYKSHPIIIYYYFYNFLNSHTLKDYEYLKASIQEKIHQLDASEQWYIYKAVRNSIYNIINETNTNYFKQEGYYWLVTSIDKGFLNSEGYLPPKAYYNLIITGLKLGYFDSTYTNIMHYETLLHPKYKGLYSDCVWGYYYFYLKDFKKSAYYFSLLGLTEDPIIIYAQIRLLQLLYQKQDLETLKSKLNYFSKKIKSIQFNNSNDPHYINLQIQILQLLIKVKKDKKHFKLYLDFIAAHPSLLFKEWYLEQIQNLQ